MTRETAYAYWGRDAVEHALGYESPAPITPALAREVEERGVTLAPSDFRAWALGEPWPRFCTIVWIVSGAMREWIVDGSLPKTLLAEEHDDDDR